MPQRPVHPAPHLLQRVGAPLQALPLLAQLLPLCCQVGGGGSMVPLDPAGKWVSREGEC